MSIDKSVTEDLMKTLENGNEGFEKAASLLENEAPHISAQFKTFAKERSAHYNELKELAKDYGDDVQESGSIAAALHRGWMSIKDAVTGDDPKGVLEAAEQGEDHTVKAYEKALEADLSSGLRLVVARQFTDVQATHDKVRDLRDTHAAASK